MEIEQLIELKYTTMSILDSKIPAGNISDKWTDYKNHLKLVAPNNRPKIDIIVVVAIRWSGNVEESCY